MGLEQPVIRPGCRVDLHIAISLIDGTEVVSTFGQDPVHCVVGDGTLDPGLERFLWGLGTGDRQTKRLEPGQAYGVPDQAKVHWLPLSELPPGLELAPNQVVVFTGPGGQELAGTVLELQSDRAKVDFNHPLAGRPLICRIEILSVVP
jgi:FKBP-type peptidyl-prolyl cis-trans isomerase SlpA